MTCYNRRETTLACLRCLAKQELPDGHRLEFFLVDDGSHDGTGDAVRQEFPDVSVLQGTGSLYWCGGMRLAWQEASKIDPDYYLAMNDDTMIIPDAVRDLLTLVGPPENRTMAVAAISDESSGEAIYGGHGRYPRHHPLKLTGKALRCATVNANCLLIPRAVYREIGIFHPYTHGLADYDYGFTASRRGIVIWQSAECLGTCKANLKVSTWEDRNLPRAERLRKLSAPTGLPLKDHLIFRLRHYPLTWPRHVLGPYVRILLGL